MNWTIVGIFWVVIITLIAFLKLIRIWATWASDEYGYSRNGRVGLSGFVVLLILSLLMGVAK